MIELSSIVRFADGDAEWMIDLSTGNFAAALSSQLSQRWSQLIGDEHVSVPKYFQAIEKHAGLQQSCSDSWLQLQIAVGAFLTFTQANLTGYGIWPTAKPTVLLLLPNQTSKHPCSPHDLVFFHILPALHSLDQGRAGYTL